MAIQRIEGAKDNLDDLIECYWGIQLTLVSLIPVWMKSMNQCLIGQQELGVWCNQSLTHSSLDFAQDIVEYTNRNITL